MKKLYRHNFLNTLLLVLVLSHVYAYSLRTPFPAVKQKLKEP